VGHHNLRQLVECGSPLPLSNDTPQFQPSARSAATPGSPSKCSLSAALGFKPRTKLNRRAPASQNPAPVRSLLVFCSVGFPFPSAFICVHLWLNSLSSGSFFTHFTDYKISFFRTSKNHTFS
jgi:hypothetical protein